MPSAVVLSHRSVAHELGHLEPWLAANDLSLMRIYREDRPQIPDADLLIALGSPASVAAGHANPDSQGEIEAVSTWTGRDRPYLGICFGAQVLALACGGRVRRLPRTFRGYVPIDADTDHSDVLEGPWLVWHNDAITAPASAQVLGTLAHADLAFRIGRAWGLQPHIEVTADTLDRMGIALGASADERTPLVDALHADAAASARRARALLDAFRDAAL